MSFAQAKNLELQNRVVKLLWYEPSWIAESMSAFGIFLWSLATLFSDDYDWTFPAVAMPALGVLFGPLRLAALLWLWTAPRAMCSLLGAVWWAVLAQTLYLKMGYIGAEGMYFATMCGDLLTLGKFTTKAFSYTARENSDLE